MMLRHAGLIVGAYALGSIPTGYWLGRTRGVDIRRHGSGNVGATNVFRVLGTGPGLFTFGVDCLKGLLPVLAAKALFPGELGIAAASGVAAILGHTTSPWVGFRGGKGMATAAGVFAALLPLPCLAALAVFLVITGATRTVSLGSLLGALTLAAGAFAFSAPRPLAWTAVLVAAFAFWTHRGNIQRLLRGTENRLDWKRRPS
jgi:glycerol-3-phosphate acyltransferase PlsY